MNKGKLKRDKTYYEFNGQFYGKGRLILAVIQYLAKKKSPETLQKDFDEEFNSSYPVIAPYHEGKKLSHTYRRYFIEKESVINARNGIKYVVTNQIGIGNIKPLINIARAKYGLKIRSIKAMV